MKPIHLRLSGLNSFREPQSIDFTKLCETGVFGIFGPTGSGKSTILDAITLALYGTVTRALNNTQGILNHGEDSLTVEFTFSLGSGERQRIYRAERSYKRSGDKTVRAGVCRLVQLKPEEIVLTSKADEMTSKVQQILGLNAQDFTRAVVLPQGKFAEFLSLKPKERRQMLERLFNLEVYGGRLNARINEAHSQTQLGLEKVCSHQQGLGDASSERLKQAETDLAQVHTMVVTCSQELNRLQQEYDSVKKIRQLQEQLQECREHLAELALQERDLEDIKIRLKNSERAEQIRPWLEEVAKYDIAIQNITKQLENAGQQLSSAQEEYDQISQERTQAHQARLTREPEILRRLEQVNQGIDLEGEIHEQTEHLAALRKRYDALRKQRNEIANNLSQVEGQITALRQEEIGYKNRLQEITILPEERIAVTNAVQTLDKLQELDKNIAAQTELLTDSQKRLHEADRLAAQSTEIIQSLQQDLDTCDLELQELMATKPEIEEEGLNQKAVEFERLRLTLEIVDKAYRDYLQSLEQEELLRQKIQDLQTALAEINEDQNKISEQLNAAREGASDLQTQIQEWENRHLAAKLARNLKAGEACPVCGSTHHLQLATYEASEESEKLNQELAKKLEQIAALEKTLQKSQTDAAVSENTLQNLLQELDERQAETERYLTEYNQQLQFLPVSVQELSTEERLQYLSTAVDALNRDQENLVLWKQTRETLTNRQQELQDKLQRERERFSSLQITVTKHQVEYNTALKHIETLQEEGAKLKQTLHSLGLTEAAIREKYHAFLRWDQEAVRINNALQDVSRRLSELEQEYKNLEQAKTSLDLDLKQLETEGKEAANSLKERQSKLQQLLEGKPGRVLLNALNQELDLLKEADTRTELRFNEVTLRLQALRQQYALLERELQINTENQRAANDRLNRELVSSGFTSASVAKASLCSEQERETMKQALADHEKKTAYYTAQLQELTQELAGRQISDQEWYAWPQKLETAQQKYNEALEVKGAAERTLADLQEKHATWNRLEQQRLSLEKHLERIKVLQNLLRGNAFVEFLAEEQLSTIALSASERLGQLTNYRYALELDAEGGFVMRDDANGGFRRPVNTLSGGETFLTSLALALALSTQIQLKGEVPLEFFFLDEGFGTLDPNLLEVVMRTLETLHLQNLTIGIISHVPELQNRLARRLIITPAQPGGAGSRVRLEYA